MKKSLLDSYYELISSYRNLSLPEAKRLNESIIKETDETKKKEMTDELFYGTLHVVLDYLKDNKVELFNTGSYDEEDIINGFIEEWLRVIQSGNIAKAYHLSTMINPTFVNNVVKRMGIPSFTNGMSKEAIDFMFAGYVALRNKGHERVTPSMLYELCSDVIDRTGWNKHDLESWMFCWYIEYFDEIYNAMCPDPNEQLDIFSFDTTMVHYLMYSYGVEQSLQVANPTYESTVVDDIFQEELHDYLDASLSSLPYNHEQVLRMYYGFDCEPKNQKEIAKELKISASRIYLLDREARRKLRHPKYIRWFQGKGSVWFDDIEELIKH